MNDLATSPLMGGLLANPLLGPLLEFGFMRSALLGCVALWGIAVVTIIYRPYAS